MPAAVVFDNDGLLLDTESTWTLAGQALFRAYGSEFTVEHKAAVVPHSPFAALAALRGEPAPARGWPASA